MERINEDATLKWTSIEQKKASSFGGIVKLFEKKDLILLLVKRDFAKEFKQTILGPIWFILQPLFQTAILYFVFGRIGKMGPDGLPLLTFYLAGSMAWGTFSENLLKTSETFRTNAQIFSKVYFPRIVMPVSYLLTNYMKLAVQFIVLTSVFLFEISNSNSIEPNWTLVFLPLYFVVSSFIGFGFGLILCTLTTKYWDLRFLIQYAIQLLMFLSAVVTPLSNIEPGITRTLIQLNPISSLVEAIRYGLLGKAAGTVDFLWISYSIGIAISTIILGSYFFRRVERSFVDTI